MLWRAALGVLGGRRHRFGVVAFRATGEYRSERIRVPGGYGFLADGALVERTASR
jgi:hypothetical protein